VGIVSAVNVCHCIALDRIGMELQNPFDTQRIDFLPLDEIFVTIEKDLLEMLHDDGLHDYAAPTVADVELAHDATTDTSTDKLPFRHLLELNGGRNGVTECVSL
jgi:hypothetical protein